MSETNSVERKAGRVLHLTLKRQWFDMIASGVKKEEYREIKPYWVKRLAGQHYDSVQFRNGYSATAPTMILRIWWIDSATGVEAWGAVPGQLYYVIRLGEMIQAPNFN